MIEVIVIAHDIRSTHNVGSLFRTCEGLGVKKLYLTGYTPYPAKLDDERLPHITKKLSAQINKTALGADKSLPWEHRDSFSKLISSLKAGGFEIVALEQTKKSLPLPSYTPSSKLALIIGNELEGLNSGAIKQVDNTVEIPMFGKKESFNVVQAAAMALYHIILGPK